jgi:hypothetical protein
MNVLKRLLFSIAMLAGAFVHAQTNHLVISQVYGAGGNTGALLTHDYVELFNPTGSTVSLSGWSLQYASATGTSWTVVGLTGTILPGRYFLVQLTGGTTGSPLPTPDMTGTLNMSGTVGKLALVNSTTTLTGGCPVSTAIIDFVGFGSTANCFEGAGPTPAPSTTLAIFRANGGCTDTNNNATNFSTGAPAPRNSSSPAVYCYPVQLAITSIVPSSPVAGQGFEVTVEAWNAAGLPQPVLEATTVSIGNAGGGLLSGTSTGIITQGSSSITLNGVVLSAAGSGITLTATRTAGQLYLAPGTSAPFEVVAGGGADCLGIIGGSALPGSPCDDLDPCTVNDTFDGACLCTGTYQDSDGDGSCDAEDGCPNDPLKTAPGDCGCGALEVGMPCSDGNACTTNDVITACGICQGTALPDVDGDGTCDDLDGCPNDPLKTAPGTCGCGAPEPGTACDDLNALTTNDTIQPDCSCAGTYPSIYYNCTSAVATQNNVLNTTASDLAHGNINGTAALISTTSASSGYAGASAGGNAGAAARTGALVTGANGSAYFEVVITPEPGLAFTLTAIRFGSRSTGTGPLAYSLRSNLDNYATDIATGSLPSSSSWVLRTHTNLSTTSLSGQPIIFRLYGHSGAGSSTPNTVNWRIDDLDLQGYVQQAAVLPVVGFNTATSIIAENSGQLLVSVTMDEAPSSTVVVEVSDTGAGTSVAGVHHLFSTSSLTFDPNDSYPLTQTVQLDVIDNSIWSSNRTVALQLAVLQGSALTSITSHSVTITEDDLPALVINEIDYDQPGTDTGEFIELYNADQVAVPLDGMQLVLVNGSNGAVYSTVTLPVITLAPGAYHVVCYGNNAASYCAQTVVTAIQNGDPDGVRLQTADGNVIDRMSYGGAMSTTEGSSAPAISGAFAGLGLSRIPNGQDTNNNLADFLPACISPGLPNSWNDADGDGVNDCADVCGNGPEPGTPCDDGNPNTVNDRIRSSCLCLGDLLDCEGIASGPALPGTACNDNDPGTVNDEYQADCSCAGVLVDCLGVPGGSALPGSPCDDGDPCTSGETYDAFCGCSGGTTVDTDGDGLCDAVDPCPLAVDGAPGLAVNSCDCVAGKFAITQLVNGVPVLVECSICPPGFYCPDGLTALPCPAGTFMNMLGAVACMNCPAGTSSVEGSVACTPLVSQVTVSCKAFLDGAYVALSGLMRDDLRSLGHLPLAQPYAGLPWAYAGAETVSLMVLATTGDDAIVDWVLLELRSNATPSLVLARRAALLQRDGDVVDLDGSSPVLFTGQPADAYHVALRHRNHLSVMTAAALPLSSTTTVVDFTVNSTAAFGSDARKILGNGVLSLWAGNANANTLISYSGGTNDRTAILNLLGAATYLVPAAGYFSGDVNMNGVVSYSGSTNDRTTVLNTLGASTYLTPVVEQLP